MKNHGISGKEMSFMIHLLTGIPPNSYQIFLRSNLKRLKMSHIRFTHVFSTFKRNHCHFLKENVCIYLYHKKGKTFVLFYCSVTHKKQMTKENFYLCFETLK